MKRALVLLSVLLLLCCAAYGEAAPEEAELLHLSFDEGQGAVIQDVSGHLGDAQIQYQYLAPAYTEPMDPQLSLIHI